MKKVEEKDIAARTTAEAKRWEKLNCEWKLSNAQHYTNERDYYSSDYSDVTPGVFKVYHEFNTDCDTYNEFVCVADSEGEARQLHPGGKGDACKYEKSELQRNEDWAVFNHGRAPGWYMGAGETWVHGAYVTVKRICEYVIPRDRAPEYGVFSSCLKTN